MNKRNTQYIIDTYNKHGKVMEAFLAGETVQIYDECTKVWNDFEVIEPSWLLAGEYRVKPKSKYRPFKSFDEAKSLIDTVIQGSGGYSYLITGIGKEGVYINGSYNRFETLFESFTINGSPVGVICNE